MTVAYNISIPEPALPQKHICPIAQLHTPRGLLCAYWQRSTQQVVLHSDWDDAWYIQPDENIIDSLSVVLGVHSRYIVINDLFVFQNRHGKLADDLLNNALYECVWSDYGCDRMSFQGTVDYPEYAVA